MPKSVTQMRRAIRRMAGRPVASGRIPARPALVLERYQALFDSITLPPQPLPLMLVHTGGKPLRYQTAGRRRTTQSLPGLVTFVPRNVRAHVALRGVGEGTVVYFDDARPLPSWLLRGAPLEPVTLTNDVIVSITRRLTAGLESRAPDEAYAKALAHALLAELQHEFARPRGPAGAPATRGELRISHVAIQHMLAHLDEPLPVKALAAACGVGVTSFALHFRQATGVTPHRYLRRARIERACELLRTTGLGIGEVAAAVGFGGQSHFCTAFVAERGLTPSAYRRGARTAPAA